MKVNDKQRIFSIVGRSGSGKTTLIEKLIRHYTSLAITVGVIKHTRHEIQPGAAGKDTDRFRRAGASGNMITDGKDFVFAAAAEDTGPVALARRYFFDYGVVIIEGWKESDMPKLEVVGPSIEPPLFSQGIANIKFIVSRRPIETDLPVYDTEDMTGITQAIENLML